MRKPIAGIDNDGVMFDLITPWLGRYNFDWKDNLTPSQILDWNIHQFVKPECGKQLYKYIEDPTIYDDVLPIDGAIDGIKSLREMGYDILFVTHSTKGHVGRKYELLKQYGLIQSDREYLEKEDKSNVKCDYLLDDYIKNVTSFNSGIGVLFTQSYNKGFIHTPRVDNWEQAIRYFKKELDK